MSTRGARPCFLRSLRNRRLAASLSRRLWTRTSRTKPSWSTARQSQCFFPAKRMTTSSRCHLSPRRGARRRMRLANSRPNLSRLASAVCSSQEPHPGYEWSLPPHTASAIRRIHHDHARLHSDVADDPDRRDVPDPGHHVRSPCAYRREGGACRVRGYLPELYERYAEVHSNVQIRIPKDRWVNSHGERVFRFGNVKTGSRYHLHALSPAFQDAESRSEDSTSAALSEADDGFTQSNPAIAEHRF